MNTLPIILTGFSLVALNWLRNINRTRKWIKRCNEMEIIPDYNKSIHVLLPVLKEEKRIKNTVEYFLKTFSKFKNLKISIITTEAESLYPKNKMNTIDIAKDLSKLHKNVLHFHYPKLEGKMAHQVNYAVKELAKKYNLKTSILALYNADSKPDEKTFDWVTQNMRQNTTNEVYQQYGNYLLNYDKLGHSLKKAILISAGSWQNRWSYGFEIPHALSQKNKFNLFGYPLNYCIGHGLFFTKRIFDKLGGFSEEMHNEDAIFGLELSYFKEEITPIPFFDLSESPDSLKGLLIQKRNWFFGPFQAFKYFKKIISKRKNIKKPKLFVLSLKLFFHALYWIIGPSLFLLSLILLIFNYSWINLMLFLMIFFIFLPIINFLSNKEINKNKKQKPTLFYNLFGSFIMYLMHGLSAYLAIFQILISKLFRVPIKKGKTEMKNE
jgi:cellulose synthase/poly-beta-1,6-N-acetylglucosamine synthase-like glycosyltransferase